MSDFKNILFEKEGSLGKILLNRPETRNALDRTMATEILSGMRLHFVDPDVRSVLIMGVGDAFCAGGDLRQMRELSSLSGGEAYDWSSAIVEAHKAMLTAEKPVIAAVNGPALAGGMGLAGMCDILIAVEGARFGMPEAKIGLFPMIIIAQLARSLPRKILLEMMMTGESIDAQEAFRLGFVNKVAQDSHQLENIIKDYAEKFEKVSPFSISLGRKAFTLLSDLPASQALDTAQFMNLPFFYGEDLKEGADAFLEKRNPKWK
jgi:methylglutaconyl-CoA hydratase